MLSALTAVSGLWAASRPTIVCVLLEKRPWPRLLGLGQPPYGVPATYLLTLQSPFVGQRPEPVVGGTSFEWYLFSYFRSRKHGVMRFSEMT